MLFLGGIWTIGGSNEIKKKKKKNLSSLKKTYII